ncbi:MAG TPA: hypothetical protein VEV16_04445 [Daejeonella sp.]|nr:hypothetical protein [Daejeonella sp.]
MKDFEALKNIWQAQVAVPKVSYEDVLKRVRKSKNSLAKKLLIELISMGLAISLLLYIWIASPFKLWTTHLAMFILVACCFFYLYTQIRDYKRIKNDSLLLSKPEDYIIYLKKFKQDRYILNTRKYRIYTLFFSLGILLYFIEISFIASIWVTVLGLAATVAWIIYCYVILMRNYIRKEETKLEEMIENLERLQKQFVE